MNRANRIVTAATLLLLGACGQRSADSTSAPAVQALHTGADIFEQMRLAPEHTRFAGVRNFWVRVLDENGVERILEYQETVSADGLGGFAIEPGSVTQPLLTSAQQDVFNLLQRLREGFLFRYRDLRVRDAALMIENYTPRVPGTTRVIAGRTCDELFLDREAAPRRHYVVAVDQATRLVLRWEELDEHDRPIGRMEFTSFDAAPSLAGVTMHVDLPSTPLDVHVSNRDLLGFPLRLPTLVHDMQLERAEKIEVGGRTWARVLYHDGIEPLFYLVSGRAAVPAPGTPPPPPAAEPQAPVVRVFQAGSFVVARCDYGDATFVVAGEFDEASIVKTLRSAVE
jgi:hypothetical protein